MIEFENREEIVLAIEQLESHGQYFLSEKDLFALDILIDDMKTALEL